MSRDEPPALKEARAKLQKAINEWLQISAKYDETDYYEDEEGRGEEVEQDRTDFFLTDWVVIAGYTSFKLERDDLTAVAYECADTQAVYTSRGLCSLGVEHWSMLDSY